MRVRQVKPHEIPLRLLRQKKVWDLRVFYELAMSVDSWTAYLLGDDDDPWGAIIIEDSPLAMAVSCQTIIVDKARRTQENVMAAAIYAHEATLEKARELGRPYVGCGVKNPEKFLEILGHPPTAQIVECWVREEV